MSAAPVYNTEPTTKSQRHYLETLFGDVHGYIDLRFGIPDKTMYRYPVASVDAALDVIKAQGEGKNVYVGIATRKTSGTEKGDGGKENLAEVNALWVDLDYRQEGDREAFEAKLKSFPHPPSMLVDSGHGGQPYWLFDEPFNQTTKAARDRFELVLKGLADYFHADPKATDSSRILRIPGTVNYPNEKKRSKGLEQARCELLLRDTGNCYSMDDFEAFEDRGRSIADVSRLPGTANVTKLPGPAERYLTSTGDFPGNNSRQRNAKPNGSKSNEEKRLTEMHGKKKPSVGFSIAKIPEELKGLPNWVLWKPELRDGKWTKPPYQVENPAYKASSTKPSDWSDFETSVKVAQEQQCGIGFALAEDFEIVGVDFDNSLDNEDFLRWIKKFNSYAEISPSGNGYRIFVKGKIPKALKKGAVECYSKGRYLTVTGNQVEGSQDSIRYCNGELEEFYAEFVPPRVENTSTPRNSSEPVPSSVEEVLSRIRRSEQENKFFSLYEGSNYDDDRKSEDDAALLAILAFWCEHDAQLMRAVALSSKRDRPKWLDKRGDKDWLDYEIKKVCDEFPATYDPDRKGAGLICSLPGLAKRFAYANASEVAWVSEWRSWVAYKELKWEKQEPELFFSRVLSTVKEYLDGSTHERDFGTKCMTPSRLKDALALSKELLVVPASTFDAVPYLLNLPNGTLDLRLNGEGLREHRSDDHLTTFCPTEFVPGKISPLWRKALHHALPDRATRLYFQRCMGYALLGKADEDFLLFQLGETRSGKGTTQQAITAALGDDYVVTCASGDFAKAGGGREASEHLHGLRGKRLAVVPEHNRRTYLNSDLLKSLTGGDKQRTRGLYQRPETWTPQCTLVIASNPGLRLEFEDDALWRRVRVVPFTETLAPTAVDPTVRESLRRNPEEHQAVLSWLYHGCIEYQQVGLMPPKSVELATRELREEIDPLAEWFDGGWEVDPNSTTVIPNAKLLASYQSWCEDVKLPAKDRKRQRGLSIYLKAKGAEKDTIKGARGFRGIKPK